MSKILLAGATGFIGSELTMRLLASGYEVVMLARRPAVVSTRHARLRVVAWDGKSVGDWASEADGAKAVINLCGVPIADKPWTEARKKEILTSRLHPLQALVQAAVRAANPPHTLISASAVGFYGNMPPELAVTETTARGDGFLAEVCAQWEKAAGVAASFGVRVVTLRFGIVLAADGGVLAKLIPPFRSFLGGPLGSGKQILPWVHREDAVGAILHALEHHDLSGPVNVTAPHPATMKEFCAELGGVMGRPSWLPVPGFVLRRLMGESAEMVLSGQRALPRKLMDGGYKFKHPHLKSALANIVEK